MTEQTYNVIAQNNANAKPIKAWTRGVALEEAAEKQLRKGAIASS